VDSAAFDPKQSHQCLHQSAIQERRTIKQNQTTRCKKEYELNAADDREHLLHLYIQYFFPSACANCTSEDLDRKETEFGAKDKGNGM
jgi:collagenase-like PrtC family protease